VLTREGNASVFSIENDAPISMAPPLSSCLIVARESSCATLNDWKTSNGTDPVEAADPPLESVDTCVLRFKQNSDAFSIVSSSFQMRVDNFFKSSFNSMILPVPRMAMS
jgi:hypothetical protein